MSIGERLKARRHAAGLSLRALADKVGVSAQAISKYERGLDVPSSPVLLRLAGALGVKVEYFFRPQAVSITPLYRKRMALGRKQERAVLSQIQEGVERYLEAESLFADEHIVFALPPESSRAAANVNQAETVAVALRRQWDRGLGPIENMVQLLEDHGVKVQLVEGYPHFDACSFTVNDKLPVIAVKRGLPGDRQRFNLAHELGHLVLVPTDGPTGDPADGPAAEKAANRFAGAFLVPEPTARFELGNDRRRLDPYELHLLKHKYGLSMQAWIYRAKDIGIISEAAASRLFSEFRSKGWHKSEPGDSLPSEEPRRLTQLVLRALIEDVISEPRAAELLGQPLSLFLKNEAKRHDGFPTSICG